MSGDVFREMSNGGIEERDMGKWMSLLMIESCLSGCFYACMHACKTKIYIYKYVNAYGVRGKEGLWANCCDPERKGKEEEGRKQRSDTIISGHR